MGVGPRCLSALTSIIAILSAVVAWGMSAVAQAPDRAPSAAEVSVVRPGGDPAAPVQPARSSGGDLVAFDDDDAGSDRLDIDRLVAVLPAVDLGPTIRQLVASAAGVPAPVFGCGGCTLPRGRGPPAA
jgi:hypothetical protein